MWVSGDRLGYGKRAREALSYCGWLPFANAPSLARAPSIRGRPVLILLDDNNLHQVFAEGNAIRNHSEFFL